jgi:TatD DNase family protein
MYPAADLPGVLARAWEAGVRTVLAIGIGDGPAEMHRALEIADELSGANPHTPKIYATAGIHPQEAHQATPEALARLAELASRQCCIAIGEIGLDYYHAGNPEIAVQQAALVAQMKVAAQAAKPIIIHCRTSELASPAAKQRYAASDAWKDLLRLVEEHWKAKVRRADAHGNTPAGIMHCFSGTLDQAQRSVDLGFYLSFAGNLTYPAAKAIREAAAWAPADRILIETDAPFLAPIPHRGERNEPALVAHTAEAVAALRGISLDALAQLTTANFQTLFQLPILPAPAGTSSSPFITDLY